MIEVAKRLTNYHIMVYWFLVGARAATRQAAVGR